MKRKMPRTIPFDHLGEWKKISNVQMDTPSEKVAAICKLINYPLADNVRIGICESTGGQNDEKVSIAKPQYPGDMASVFIPSSIVKELGADALGGLLLATAKQIETANDEDLQAVNRFIDAFKRAEARKSGDTRTQAALKFAKPVLSALENAKAREAIEDKNWKFGGYFNAFAKEYFKSLDGNGIEPLLAAIQTGDPSFIDNCSANPDLKAAMEKALAEAQKTQKSTAERTKSIVNIIDEYINPPPPEQKQEKQDGEKKNGKQDQSPGEEDKNDSGNDQKNDHGKDKQNKNEEEPKQHKKREVADPNTKFDVILRELSMFEKADKERQSTFVSVKEADRPHFADIGATVIVEAGPAQQAIFERDQKANLIAEAVAGRIIRAKKTLRHFAHGTDSGELDDLSLPNYPLSDRPNIWMQDRSHKIKKGKFKVALLIDVSGSMQGDYHNVASMTTGISAGLGAQGINVDCFAFSNSFYVLESPLAIYKNNAFYFGGTPLCNGIIQSKNVLDVRYGIDTGATDRFFFVVTDGDPSPSVSDAAVLTGAGGNLTANKTDNAINSSKAALKMLARSGWTSFGFGYGDGVEPDMLHDIFGDNNIVMGKLDPALIASTISDVVASQIYHSAQELSSEEDGVKI